MHWYMEIVYKGFVEAGEVLRALRCWYASNRCRNNLPPARFWHRNWGGYVWLFLWLYQTDNPIFTVRKTPRSELLSSSLFPFLTTISVTFHVNWVQQHKCLPKETIWKCALLFLKLLTFSTWLDKMLYKLVLFKHNTSLRLKGCRVSRSCNCVGGGALRTDNMSEIWARWIYRERTEKKLRKFQKHQKVSHWQTATCSSGFNLSMFKCYCATRVTVSAGWVRLLGWRPGAHRCENGQNSKYNQLNYTDHLCVSSEGGVELSKTKGKQQTFKTWQTSEKISEQQPEQIWADSLNRTHWWYSAHQEMHLPVCFL